MPSRFVSHRPSRKGSWPATILLTGCLLLTLCACTATPGVKAPLSQADRDAAESSQAFLEAYAVLIHPRCLNCHPKGNRPLQGDDSRPHGQNVQRGETGHGKYALKCSNCHQQDNLRGLNMPPGAPGWHMPPADIPMVFQGRTPTALCRQLLDPEQNDNMDADDIVNHISNDPLVLWGWEPGDGRSLPPLSHAEFEALMEKWVEMGAACP